MNNKQIVLIFLAGVLILSAITILYFQQPEGSVDVRILHTVEITTLGENEEQVLQSSSPASRLSLEGLACVSPASELGLEGFACVPDKVIKKEVDLDSVT